MTVTELEARVKKLETLVEVLRKAAGINTVPCEHATCQMTGGYWQDGSKCGHCHGTQVIVVDD